MPYQADKEEIEMDPPKLEFGMSEAGRKELERKEKLRRKKLAKNWKPMGH
jgi:hypothetical protein